MKKNPAKQKKPDVDPKRDPNSPDPFPIKEPKKKRKIKEPGKPRPKMK